MVLAHITVCSTQCLEEIIWATGGSVNYFVQSSMLAAKYRTAITQVLVVTTADRSSETGGDVVSKV